MCSLEKIQEEIHDFRQEVGTWRDQTDSRLTVLEDRAANRDKHDKATDGRLATLEDAVALMTKSQEKIDELLATLEMVKRGLYFLASTIVTALVYAIVNGLFS